MDTRIWDIIGKYVKEEATQEETDVLNAWLEEDPQNKEVFDESLRVWESTEKVGAAPKVDINEEWTSFVAFRDKEETSETKEISLEPSGKEPKGLFGNWIVRVAAAIVVAAGLHYYINVSNDTGPVAAQMIEHTSTTSKLRVDLPDGSEVWLNKESKISYTEGFGTEHRTLSLRGEAFFDVQKSTQTFTILGVDSKTEVLGTAFNVRSVKGEEQAEVIVVRGKVSFSQRSNPSNEVTLEKGQKGTLDVSNNTIAKSSNSDPNFMAWKEEVLIFDGSGFDQVVLALENYFDVDIVLDNQGLNKCHFTGTFKKPVLEEVLEIMSASLKLKYNQEGDQITIAGQGCS